MGQNMISWICDKQAKHEVTHFCHRSYLKNTDCADTGPAGGDQSGPTARAMGNGQRGALAAARGVISGTEGDWPVGRCHAAGLGSFSERGLAHWGTAANLAEAHRSTGGLASASA